MKVTKNEQNLEFENNDEGDCDSLRLRLKTTKPKVSGSKGAGTSLDLKVGLSAQTQRLKICAYAPRAGLLSPHGSNKSPIVSQTPPGEWGR